MEPMPYHLYEALGFVIGKVVLETPSQSCHKLVEVAALQHLHCGGSPSILTADPSSARVMTLKLAPSVGIS